MHLRKARQREGRSSFFKRERPEDSIRDGYRESCDDADVRNDHTEQTRLADKIGKITPACIVGDQ